jgi:hypothetical protein
MILEISGYINLGYWLKVIQNTSRAKKGLATGKAFSQH